MSFQAMAWAVDIKLPVKEKITLLMLANYASNENGDCYPSINTLADVTGMSRDSVMRAIKSLEELGLLRVNRRQVEGVNLPNSYTLNLRGVVAHSDQGSSTQRGGVVAVSDSNLSSKPINEPEKHIGVQDQALDAFELYWGASTKHGSKKKAAGIFAAICKREKRDPMEFAAMLITDTAARLKAQQFGFEKMHATTYLNQERWNDARPIAAPGKQSITQDFQSKDYRSTPDDQLADFLR